MYRYLLILLVHCFVQDSLGFFPENEIDNFQCCFTPENKLGKCVVIQECEELNNRLLNHPTSKDYEYVQKSNCGYIGQLPKVCCPLIGELNNNLLPNQQKCGLMLSNKIIGGQATSLGEYPWTVLLEYDKPTGRGYHCGGTLISSRYVLTAAHCLRNIPKTWTLISVRLGEHNLETDPDCEETFPGFRNCNDSPVDIPVEEQIAHEDYSPRNKDHLHDIALLRLRRNVTYTDFIAPICLPITADLLNIVYSGLNMTVAGWGRTENSSKSNIKLKLEVPIASYSECLKTYQKANVNLSSGQFCAGGMKGKDSCTGDSGGPLMMLRPNVQDVNYYIAGIVSFGPILCGTEDWPGVYTRVTNYIPWIVNNMKP